ncbi:hypothetical protein HD554DRAFT_2168109 [Boletus coccyginus]|nr:hypothetical protein HD554DRAFT_2168109 [Boletus coccyginus]
MKREHLGPNAATNGVAVNSAINNSGSAATTNNSALADFNWNALNDENGISNADGNEDVNTRPSLDVNVDELDISDSEFRLNGKPVHFNSSKFWNYINYMLNVIHQTAHKTAAIKELYDKELEKYMVKIFQNDLAECPGFRRGTKIISVVNPSWQSTIQQELVW